ncbi:chalcone isomerase family protein [Acinetobacter nosocomialis]|uniref:chalcone isomerase family protein n=1 Tax=Acinetobacter nosocomialis TaxID=106654 RepID=UPI001ADD4498|nr:chalcone isomerase family protein [Acinetobacter nosocomialis]MBO8215216.1 chalcone isomerase family protein [Acinetobacter nosocomialis]MDE3323308.1 chalcone isomerase family protein [Acinetobacter nosocomialis]
MDIAIQKNRILILLGILLASHTNAAELKKCSSAPLMVTSKKVGNVSYFAEDCQKNWQNQSIKMDFSYNRDIPEWAFKRAATHFLKKNVSGFDAKSPLNHINELYRPIKSGDLYSLYYQHENQKLELKLNQNLLGSIINPNANQYFKIWFGTEPFNAKLKQQLLN